MGRRSDRTGGPSVLGSCPNCDTSLSAARLLIRYETAEEGTKQFAACPGCRDVVHPR